jgi:murein DD-endopeptidase MepM/ murein hydrolase activator NlpD/beta-lactamase superfamily II metal-dependent hydrolase/3D (Asp-Asp-Asp) domain-containing protein
MKELNIGVDNVVRHADTQDKDCPWTINNLNKWDYIKNEIKKRNEANQPISFTTGSGAGTGTSTSVGVVGGNPLGTSESPLYATPTDIEVQLPDVDHRENITNMDEVRGVSVIFYPPYNSCETYEATDHFASLNWNRNYHYTIGKIDPNKPEDTEPENPGNTEEEDSGGDGSRSVFDMRNKDSKNRAYIYNIADGLCVFIRNDGTNILVDCGEKNEAVKKGVLDHISALGVNTIHHVILTHFHSDHVAGFKDFANKFTIENVYYKDLDKSKLAEIELSDTWRTDKYYDEVLNICKEKQINQTKITADKTVSCVKIFAGDTSDNYSNYNRQSLSMIVTMNDKKLFIGGDIIESTEKLILPKLSKCDAMIIAHHGYAGSNCQEILDKIDASNYFVTTYITDDDAHKEVIDRVSAKNSNFYSTHNNKNMILLDFNEKEITHDAENKVTGDSTPIEGEGDPVGGDKLLETAEGFEIKAQIDELLQTKGFTDNDTHTYIDRALFQNKRQKHNLTVSLMCPKDVEDYPSYEKALIEGLSIILHEHGLEVKDLWREFDLNRAPSPFLYLDRDKWKDFLCEVEKQLNWRNIKFGKYEKQYEKYTAGSSGLSGGGTGSINPGSITVGGGSGSFGTLGGGDWTQGQVGGDCLLFIKSEEGFAPNVYIPPEGGGNKAIGYGCTKFPGSANPAFEAMSSQQPITEEIAAKYLADEINKNYAAPILDCCKNTLKITKQCQFDALVSVSYNAGPGSITNSSSKLHQAIKKNPDDEATIRACWESYKTTGGGKHMEGLVKRRKKECDMYFGKAVDYKKIAIIGGGGGYVTDNDGKGWLPTSTDTTTNDTTTDETTPDNNEENNNENNEAAATSYSVMPIDNVIPDSGGGSTTTTPEGGTTDTTNNNGIFGWPLPGYSKVSSKFGPRVPPCPGASSNHGGIDIGGVPRGTPILSYAAGTVEVNKKLSGAAGNYIKIDHGNGVASRYLHMDEQSPLKVGDTVAAGQEVGKVGSTGVGTGVHLHFEIWINGEKVDPLLYVNPGGGTKDNPNINPGQGSTGSGPGSISGGTVGSDSDNLLYDDKKQPNTNAPIGENSAGDVNHDDWGGKMIYKKGEAEDANAEQPEILNIITQEEYLNIIQYSDFKLVDDYMMDFEPYSKGLASIEDNMITPNDRINAMTKKFTTQNENTFHYKVIESGPGSKDHCVTIAEELNYIAVPEALTVEPIYPDLVIPPGYISTDADAASPNSIPIAVVEEGSKLSSDMFTKQLSFDYDVLKDKKKESNKTHHPINYADPYPYDDKITDLERHYPKVFIDEIEGQLYSCNHPGCPISQPMAKNFAMLSDALLNQSKRMEKRLSRLENILSTVIRNQGRLGARMNINCVYYGGHSTFNKYKCIRCLHDDRIHDGQLVTIDQCLNCTRFEPILGQVYKILDDSGLNGSIILDDMQMSYTDLQGFKNLNDITCRSSRYYNAMATEESNCTKPEKDLETIWKEADKEQAIAAIRATEASDADKQIEELKEENYIFKMDWAESFFNSQEPDTKPYLNEGIVARQKVEQGDGASLEDTLALLDPVMDADEIEEIKERIKIRDNIWVDTREIADAVQINKYTSENFFFEDFNKVRIGKYGIKFSSAYNYNGEDYTSIYSVSSITGGNNLANGSTGAFASDVRNKICDMAKQIVADYDAGKAKYCQGPRTVDYTKPQSSGGKVCYDCTSFVSCCYLNAGLNSMYNKSCSGKTMVNEILKGGIMFLCNEANLAQARPGDVLIRAKRTLSEADMNKFVETEHAMIYLGDGKAAHASSPSIGIKIVELGNRLTKGTYFFARPADLIEADRQADQQAANAGLSEQSGSIDGKNYVMKIPQAVCTAYTDKGKGSSGMGCTYNATCASHNMPYGTKIYIPYLAGKAGDGVFTVTDCGGPFFDFDINTNTWNEKVNADAYVLEWGTSKNATSYTYSIDEQVKLGQWDKYKSAWGTYKNMGGKLVNLTKFNSEDANITSHARYND